jgi:hypothetical protein
MPRSSPLELTEFGVVVLRTGLSPRSGIALGHFAERFSPASEPRKGSIIRRRYRIAWEPLIDAICTRIRGEPVIRELQGGDGQKIGTSGYPVKVENFPLVTMAWASGIPLEVIALLALRGDSSDRRTIRSWFQDEQPAIPPTFEETIDQIAVFCNQYLAGRWSWVFRSASAVADYLGLTDLASDMAALSKRLEHGAKHLPTADLLERGVCPVDRAKLDWLVDSYQMLTLTRGEAMEKARFLQWIRDYQTMIEESAFTPFPRIRITRADIEELKIFLQHEIDREQREAAP